MTQTWTPLSTDPKPLLESVRNRRIAVVGNAQSLFTSDPQGDQIEAHDVVVRFNRGYVRLGTEAFAGTRTDIWVSAMTRHPKWQREVSRNMLDRKLTVWSWYDSRRRTEAMTACGTCIAIPPDALKRWHVELGARTTTGCAFLLYLMELAGQQVEVSIYGFDFFASGSTSNAHPVIGRAWQASGGPARRGPHRPILERAFLLGKLRNFPKFRFIGVEQHA